MKRISIFIMAVVCILGGYVIKDGPHPNEVLLHTSVTTVFDEKALPNWPIIEDIDIAAESAILMDAKTGHIIYEKNKDQSLSAASMSKIMSELLILEAIESGDLQWDDSVEISDYAYMISTTPGLASAPVSQDQTYTVKQLFDLMAVISANDATIALAEKRSGSEKDFVQLMNEKAKQLGLEQTNFVNSSGLNNIDLGNYYSTGATHDDNQLSAYDLALLARKILKDYPSMLDISKQTHIVFEDEKYQNTNMLLVGSGTNLEFAGVDGLKTGFTDEAGYCFVGTIEQDGQRFISVVMGTTSVEERFIQTAKLYEAAKEIYSLK